MSLGTCAATLPLYDAIVVGAGPAGSALAAWLAGEGWRVLVVERERMPHHKVCGEFLSPEAQTTLGALRLTSAVQGREPVLLRGAQLSTHSGRCVTLNLPGTAWGISRYALDHALVEAAAQRGAQVLTGTTVRAWHMSATGMVVHLRQRNAESPTKLQARAVVLACGRHGAALLLPDKRGPRPAARTRHAGVGIKCHFANVDMPCQTELYLLPGGYIGINPVEGGRANVCAFITYDAFARGGRSPHALIEAAVAWNPAFGARLRGASALTDTACAVAPVDTRAAAMPWQELPLLGDTAAMIPPLVGDGMAMALRSAELCGPLLDSYLRGAGSWSAFCSRYQQHWHCEFAPRLRLARLLERVLLTPRMANLLVGAGASWPFLADSLVRATRGRVSALPHP